MSIDRRKFLQGLLATGVVAVGASAVTGSGAQAASGSVGSAEAFLLATGRRALG